jgi:phage baseplate assembly protein W
VAYTRADKFTESVKIQETFSDFSNAFTKHPVSDELITVKNVESIKQSFKNLIRTNIGERLFNPFFGTNVGKALFEPIGPFLEEDIRRYIFTATRQFEPRVNVVKIDVNAGSDENSLRVDITFAIINTNTISSVTVYLKRVR